MNKFYDVNFRVSITSEFTVLYVSYLNFINMAWIFNVCCISEVKMVQNNRFYCK
jgi:hypothetical protein